MLRKVQTNRTISEKIGRFCSKILFKTNETKRWTREAFCPQTSESTPTFTFLVAALKKIYFPESFRCTLIFPSRPKKRRDTLHVQSKVPETALPLVSPEGPSAANVQRQNEIKEHITCIMMDPPQYFHFMSHVNEVQYDESFPVSSVSFTPSSCCGCLEQFCLPTLPDSSL